MRIRSSFSFSVMILFLTVPARAQFIQQGPKLLGAWAEGEWPNQGYSVSISADGNTAIMGGYLDNTWTGAAWIFARNGATWSQLGNKLVGTGDINGAFQGSSVCISADGNTAIIGGKRDSDYLGAAWIFIKSNDSWIQQGGKLVGSSAVPQSYQGSSVSISADGNTAIVGGPQDNSGVGAAWIFVRSSNTWRQQGNKLVGSGYIGECHQGMAVALSSDGNTAIIGGGNDDGNNGAVWIFVRNDSTWNQQGTKLKGTGASGRAGQGCSVSLSADGNTAVIGGASDDTSKGAIWVFTRVDTVWSQQGDKLVGLNAVNPAGQGRSVSISSDGNTILEGGGNNDGNAGAVWIFTRSDSTWSQAGSKLVGSDTIGIANQGWSVSLSGDGNTAVVGGFNDSNGFGAAWIFAAPTAMSTQEIPAGSTTNVNFPGTGIGIQFISPNSNPVKLTVSRYQWKPVGDLSGIGLTNLASEHWQIIVSLGIIDGVYNMRADLSEVQGVLDYSTLHLIERENSYAGWIDMGVPSDVSGAPISIVWTGLTGFSQFSIGANVDNPLDVMEGAKYKPTDFVLHQNYPNPFNPTTSISFNLPKQSYVVVKIFDVIGREVAALVNENLAAGRYTKIWNASSFPSGVYFYRMDARQLEGSPGANFTSTKKLLLLK